MDKKNTDSFCLMPYISTATYYLAILVFAIVACDNPTKEELKIIKKLNDKYPDYTFSPGSGPVGTHLNLYVRESTWDSVALKMLYDSSVVAYNKSEGIPWVYLSVYNSSDKYLFTIVKDEENEYTFFKEE